MYLITLHYACDGLEVCVPADDIVQIYSDSDMETRVYMEPAAFGESPDSEYFICVRETPAEVAYLSNSAQHDYERTELYTHSAYVRSYEIPRCHIDNKDELPVGRCIDSEEAADGPGPENVNGIETGKPFDPAWDRHKKTAEKPLEDGPMPPPGYQWPSVTDFTPLTEPAPAVDAVEQEKFPAAEVSSDADKKMIEAIQEWYNKKIAEQTTQDSPPTYFQQGAYSMESTGYDTKAIEEHLTKPDHGTISKILNSTVEPTEVRCSTAEAVACSLAAAYTQPVMRLYEFTRPVHVREDAYKRIVPPSIPNDELAVPVHVRDDVEYIGKTKRIMPPRVPNDELAVPVPPPTIQQTLAAHAAAEMYKQEDAKLFQPTSTPIPGQEGYSVVKPYKDVEYIGKTPEVYVPPVPAAPPKEPSTWEKFARRVGLKTGG